mgnify:CR=1 FL=1
MVPEVVPELFVMVPEVCPNVCVTKNKSLQEVNVFEHTMETFGHGFGHRFGHRFGQGFGHRFGHTFCGRSVEHLKWEVASAGCV